MPSAQNLRSSKPANSAAHGRRERHKAAIRKRLFRAAVRLFATRGFTATTVEDITEAADVAKGTFFNYFPTKELLLADIVEFRLDLIRSARKEAEDARAPVRHILRRVLFRLMKEPGRSPAMARGMFLGSLSGGPVEGLAREILTKGHSLLSETIAIGQRRGEVRRDRKAPEIAQQFQELYYGALYLWAVHPNLNLSRCLETGFSLFWTGIASQPGRSCHSKKRAP